MEPDFLIVIPAYKESTRLPGFLEELATELAAESFSAAILVVDDGSPDAERAKTIEAVELLRRRHPNVRETLCLAENQGKGGAILAGWEAGGPARWMAFADADGAVSAAEIVRIFRMAISDRRSKSYFASRIRMLGRSVDRNLQRHISGRVFATLVGVLIHPGVYDSQCGFKVIPSTAYAAIRPWLDEKRFAFDVQLLAALLEKGFPIEEVAVDWHDVAGSKVSMMKDTINMFRCVLKIRGKRKAWRTGEPLPATSAPAALISEASK